VEPNWLSELVAVAESDEKIGSCQPKILSQSDPTTIDTVELAINRNGDACQAGYLTKDKRQYNKVKEVLGASSATVLYRRRAICQIGMFDPDFFAYFEDVDVALRLRSAGWKCMFVPTAVVYHLGAATGKAQSPFKVYLCQRNSYFYRTKNLQTSLLLKFLIKRPRAITLGNFYEENQEF